MEIEILDSNNGGILVLTSEQFLDPIYRFLFEKLEQAVSISDEHAFGVESPTGTKLEYTALLELPHGDKDYITRQLCNEYHGKVIFEEKLIRICCKKQAI